VVVLDNDTRLEKSSPCLPYLTIFGEGIDRSQIQDLYEDPDDNLYHHRLTAFLTHLVIAAAGKPVPRLPE
jgi:hypothetical protein